MEVLVFSMVDMSRAKASTMRLLELLRSSFAVVSSYSSGSTPDRDRKQAGFYCEIQMKFGRHVKPPACLFFTYGNFSQLKQDIKTGIVGRSVTHL